MLLSTHFEMLSSPMHTGFCCHTCCSRAPARGWLALGSLEKSGMEPLTGSTEVGPSSNVYKETDRILLNFLKTSIFQNTLDSACPPQRGWRLKEAGPSGSPQIGNTWPSSLSTLHRWQIKERGKSQQNNAIQLVVNSFPKIWNLKLKSSVKKYVSLSQHF